MPGLELANFLTRNKNVTNGLTSGRRKKVDLNLNSKWLFYIKVRF